MHAVYPVAEIRAAEASLLARVPEGTLMRRAAHALAVHCANVLERVYGAQVVLLVGAGNNGGDALFAGAELARRGARVSAILLDPQRAHAAGLGHFRRAGGLICAPDAGAGAGARAIAGSDLVVDGILGTG
ncbi:MAG: NAD(P)H-hydrate epimerase, partial [Actinomycetota bacterium]|nr:NAD(P)H-hydrate epimerase [Actinomycetota bacterium]